jgi:hypothetical protein
MGKTCENQRTREAYISIWNFEDGVSM